VAKKFRVEITSKAESDILAMRDFIAGDKPRTAAKWLRELWMQIASLQRNPLRYEIIPEAAQGEEPYRHVLFGNYRTIYSVDEDTVTVLRVFHAARLLRDF
jgi:plasmid stabilization system protein ParE